MSDIQSGFSKSYVEARQKFLNAAQAAGLSVDSNIHPLKGRDGEEMAMDVVLDGGAAVRVNTVPAPGLAHDLDTPAQREDWRARSSLGPKDPAE